MLEFKQLLPEQSNKGEKNPNPKPKLRPVPETRMNWVREQQGNIETWTREYLNIDFTAKPKKIPVAERLFVDEAPTLLANILLII